MLLMQEANSYIIQLFQRYYEEPKDESERKAHLVCGQCGAEGDHKQADCPVVVVRTRGICIS